MDGYVYPPEEHCYVNREGSILTEKKEVVYPFIQTRKHPQVSIYHEGVEKKHLVHRLVAKAFLNLGEFEVISIKDDDKNNCHVDNLIVHDRRGAALLSIARGRQVPNRQCTLTWEQVQEIRRIHPRGQAVYKMARELNVSKSNINKILSGATWKTKPK